MSILTAVGLLARLSGGVWVFKNKAQPDLEKISEVVFNDKVRMPFWGMAVEQWLDYPTFGAGSRSYSYMSNKYWSPHLLTDQASPEFVHNEYLQLFADYGLIGFLLISSLLVWHLIIGVQRVGSISRQLGDDGFKKGSNAMALAIAGVCGMITMAVHITFDFRTHLLANLLLFVCCAIWVLPVTRAVIRESDNQKIRKKRVGGRCLGLLILILGLAASGLGGWQLWGGMSLLQSKIAKEDGTWQPEMERLDIAIPALESSIAIAPNFRRHLKLGTLYQRQAYEKVGEQRDDLLKMAMQQYELAERRHPFDPVAKINQALLHTYFKEFPQAEQLFQSADEIAASRERWFRIRTKWAGMHRQWAGEFWKKGNTSEAAEHYKRGAEILDGGTVQASDTADMRFMVVIEHVRMMDSLKRYEEASRLFENLEKTQPGHTVNSLRHNIRREMGEHYLRYAKDLWYNRKPVQAHKVLLKAKRSFHIHQIVLKGRQDAQWESGYDEVKQILKFFKDTGIGNEQ